MSTAELPPDAARRLVTADELLHEFTCKRCELIEGEVREMSPTGWNHGSIERRIAQLLGSHVDSKKLGDVATGEVGFLLSKDPDTVLAPDVSYVRSIQLAESGATDAFFPGAPALAVEVTSPNDTASDVEDKVRRWLAAGCEMVWVVYPRGRSVTVYRSLDDVKILTEDSVLDGSDVVPGFSCPISKFFAGMP